jgi:hypothetical protein
MLINIPHLQSQSRNSGTANLCISNPLVYSIRSTSRIPTSILPKFTGDDRIHRLRHLLTAQSNFILMTLDSKIMRTHDHHIKSNHPRIFLNRNFTLRVSSF